MRKENETNMKRLWILLFSAVLLLSLVACSPAQTDPEPEAQPDEALTTLLTQISKDYHPGSAGCSLVAASLTGQILDWYAQTGEDAAAIATVTAADYYAQLNPEQALEFERQLGGMYTISEQLLGDMGASLIETAGYEPESYPWEDADNQALFDALYAGTGLLKPEAGVLPAGDTLWECELGFTLQYDPVFFEPSADGKSLVSLYNDGARPNVYLAAQHYTDVTDRQLLEGIIQQSGQENCQISEVTLGKQAYPALTVRFQAGNQLDSAIYNFYTLTCADGTVLLLETGCYAQAEEGFGAKLAAMLSTLSLTEET